MRFVIYLEDGWITWGVLGGLFGLFGRRETEIQKRERRLSDALDMIPG